MKPFQSHFVVIQLMIFIYHGQIARSQSSEDDCRSGYTCLKRRMCPPHAMKQIVGRPKLCGKSTRGAFEICCPLSTPTTLATNIQETVFQEPCGLNGEDFSANDGMEMINGRWPWMVSLSDKRREVERFLCSGFLIDRLHVVTAAHCVQGNHLKTLLVRIGSVSFRDGELYNVTRILVPYGYSNRMFYDDIALLTLSKEVDSPSFNPVCIPNPNTFGVLEGLKGTLVGYVDRNLDFKLHEQNGVPIISSEECETAFTKKLSRSFTTMFPKGINNQMLCTGEYENDNDSCMEYFSGSPLMVEKKGGWYVVGVSTFGMKGCGNNAPSGYTRITDYVDWIKQNIE